MALFDLINDVKHVVYCGPRAIGILTGVPVSRIEKMLRYGRRGGYRDRNGRKMPIRGIHTWEATAVLERLGCKVKPLKVFEPTFGRFLDDTKHLSAAFLVEVTGHLVATCQGKHSDKLDRTKRAVKQAWIVEAPAIPRYTIDNSLQSQCRAKAKPDITALRHARVLAAIKRWEAKHKRAETALKKLRRQQRYYERIAQQTADHERAPQ